MGYALSHFLLVESDSQFESTGELKPTAKNQNFAYHLQSDSIFALEIWRLEILCMA